MLYSPSMIVAALLLGVFVVLVLLSLLLQGTLSARTAPSLDVEEEPSVEPVPSLVSRIALPLGRAHDGVVCFREAEASEGARRRLLVFLQGNMMDPWDDYSEFTRRGWSVLAVGYTDTLTGSARNVLRAVNEHTAEQAEYDDVAVWSRSIGTCFAPEVCARAKCRDRIRWAAYVTPVSSIGDLTGFGGVAHHFTEGADMGFARAQDAVPHHLLLASEDQVTPTAPVVRMIRDGLVPPPARARGAAGYGHNNVSRSQERVQMLDALLGDGGTASRG
jgi:hypothetical protein